MDPKTVQTYQQVIQCILEYVLKPEETSDFFFKLKSALAKKIDDETPLNKTAQKVLMSCLGQRDMSSNECFLIAHGLPYVEFSHAPRVANLKGSSIAKTKVDNETENIKDDDNWQNAYWNREEIDGYKKLCIDYEAGNIPKEILDRHPKNISLREFMCNFSKKWKYA